MLGDKLGAKSFQSRQLVSARHSNQIYDVLHIDHADKMIGAELLQARHQVELTHVEKFVDGIGGNLNEIPADDFLLAPLCFDF